MQRTKASALAWWGCLLLGSSQLYAGQEAPMDRYNVVWDTPSEDSSGSMPLGNGDIGVNVWVEPGGDLLLYVSKSDAWSETGRLLKLGRVRLSISPCPLEAGAPFSQQLRLREGKVEVRAGYSGGAVVARVWVDANHPVVRAEVDSARDSRLTVSLECWRTTARALEGKEVYSAYGMDGGPEPVVQDPDAICDAGPDRVVWYHRNERSVWQQTLRLQGLKGLIPGLADPLLHRTFGGRLEGEGLVRRDTSTLTSERPGRRHVVVIHALTALTASPEEWIGRLDTQARQTSATDLETAGAAHRAWWAEFWQRSWVRASGRVGAGPITTNGLPLRIGADSDGANGFRGLIGRARVYGRALAAGEVESLAAGRDASPTSSEGLVGDWDCGALEGGLVVPVAAQAPHPGSLPPAGGERGSLAARAVGDVAVVEAPGGKALRLGGDGWLEVADDPALDLTQACTLEAWICPEVLGGGGARIMDKSRAATSDGYLLDTYPANSLRMIVEANTLGHEAKLPAGEWSHVAATYDAATGVQRLYVNGREVASASLGEDAAEVSRAYALQRYVSACAGRGKYPIKFNGSLFTVDSRLPDETFDADYRRWGGPYWFQNTRLAYWPMLASGDYEMMQPLFRMYRDALPLAKERTRLYFGHEGAFFPETMTFFGAYANSNYGWDRAGRPISHCDNTYIRWYWSGALELVAMMLDFWEHTQDARFAQETLLPVAHEVVGFYANHYPRRDGKLLVHPAQALETWQNVQNPLPEIAGLRYVLPCLIALPQTIAGGDQRARWQRLLAEVPELPTREIGGVRVLSPAESILSGKANCENPELYAVYPYRLLGIGKPELDLARSTFEHREVRGAYGWFQDDTQAALLGLTDEAARMVCSRFASKDPGSRFPAFWGPNFDWVPDQDHGCNGLMALQTMLMQCEGDRILLLPAWPKAWDVDFRLHAPRGTVVEGRVEGGKVVRLEVWPEERRRDVEVCEPAPAQPHAR